MASKSYRVEYGAPGDELAITELLMGLYAEVGRYAIDVEKGLPVIGQCLLTGAVVKIIDEATDALIASVGLEKGDYWYAREEFMFDRWFFIAPEHRESGVVMRMLLAECKEIADGTGLEVSIHMQRPRAPRLAQMKRPGFETTAVAMKYIPAGETIVINPKRETVDVR